MAQLVRMPPLGETTDELRIVAWLAAEGDEVEVGSPLLEVETDKTTLVVESAVRGTVLRILRPAGETLRVGVAVAVVGEPGEEIEPEDDTAGRRALAAPAVRQLAREHGIDLALVVGSGPEGRVEKRDILALIDAEESRGVPVTAHRRAIAERLTRSVQTIPQFAVGVTVDMTGCAATLEAARADGLAGLTYTHLLLRATSRALREHPDVNRVWEPAGPRLRQLERTDVGLAVASEDGLLVVTIPEPDRLALGELVEHTDRAAGEARAGRISSGYRGQVSVTVSNLGMAGVDWFVAIVDPDQTAILAAGRVAQRPAVVEGTVVARLQLELTLAVDHRVVDGVAAARFLGTVQRLLEQPGD